MMDLSISLVLHGISKYFSATDGTVKNDISIQHHIPKSTKYESGLVCENKRSYVEIGSIVLIKSPGYPNHYPAKLNCTWTISTVRNDERVRLSFQSLDIDSRGTGHQNRFQ